MELDSDCGLEAVDAQNTGIFTKPPVFAVLWHWMDDYQRLVVFDDGGGHLLADSLDDCGIRGVYGVFVVPLYAGKADHGAHCHRPFETVLPQRPEHPGGFVPYVPKRQGSLEAEKEKSMKDAVCRSDRSFYYMKPVWSSIGGSNSS